MPTQKADHRRNKKCDQKESPHGPRYLSRRAAHPETRYTHLLTADTAAPVLQLHDVASPTSLPPVRTYPLYPGARGPGSHSASESVSTSMALLPRNFS